ncbi:unnamed protein product [Toxocara canis]|uniref:Reverse transcriptase domain-containing protein n=1 Tax=Toxocara canis TaxID=6265 RepID=A0A183UMW7_TOXCA|nr:unnamed protein product [Toxocara canis]
MHRAFEACEDDIQPLRFTPKCGPRCRGELLSPSHSPPMNNYHRRDSSTDDDDEEDEGDFEPFSIRNRVRKSISAHAKLGATSLKRHAHTAGQCKESGREKDDSEEDSESDSDAEFAVHPCLRGLIKSRSAYSFKSVLVKKSPEAVTIDPLIASFKGFDLSKMAISRVDSFHEELEPPVANFSGEVFERWPAPDEQPEYKRNKYETKATERQMSSGTLEGIVDSEENEEQANGRIKASACWSAPANIVVRRGDDILQRDSDCPSPDSPLNYCWSAPEFLGDTDEEEEKAEGSSKMQSRYEDCLKGNTFASKRDLIGVYPLIRSRIEIALFDEPAKIRIGRGLEQGDICSSKALTCALERVLRNMKTTESFRIDGKGRLILLFSDHVVLVAENPGALQKLLNELDSSANAIGLKIHIGKTQWMENGYCPRFNI